VELDWLRTFLAVVDRGGFSTAAEQVHRSQSRVSAHIAALERDLGATLIDRTRRPARVTRAGEVLASHARDILGAVGSARSAVGAARDLAEGHLTLLTTPCLASSFLPDPLARVTTAFPGTRFAVLEDGRHDIGRRFLDDGVVLAVLPALSAPTVPGLRERVLWKEHVHAVVPVGHRFARLDGPVPIDELVREPLVLIGASGDAAPEVVDLLARRGVTATAAATADCPRPSLNWCGRGSGSACSRRSPRGASRRGAGVTGRPCGLRWPTLVSSVESARTGTTSSAPPMSVGRCTGRC
jgi:DNA-binding transcriptional LysR family regulator